MKSIVIDCECTSKGPKGDPSWYWKDNELLLFGFMHADARTNIYEHCTGKNEPTVAPYTDTMYIGHNIGFDLGWWYRQAYNKEQWLRSLLDPSVILWDTMLVQYILTAQKTDGKSLSLKKICVDLGIADDWSEDEISNAELISEVDLLNYNINDLENTYKLHEYQMKLLDEVPGSLDFVVSQLRALKHTIVASLRGMEFNKELARVARTELHKKDLRIHKNIVEYMTAEHPGLVWNPESTQDLGVFLFGGEKTKDIMEPMTKDGEVLRYKSGVNKGKPRTKKWTEVVKIPAMLVGNHRTQGGKWKVSDDVLQEYASDLFVGEILELRKLKKDISTYYDGMIKASDTIDNRIHPSYNHCVTATGRLSSSKPNLQNITGASDD